MKCRCDRECRRGQDFAGLTDQDDGAPVETVRDMAGDEGQGDHGEELGQSQIPQGRHVMGEGIDLPPNGDRHGRGGKL